MDIAVYTGEELPRRALTPDRIVSMLPGLFGAARVASEQKRLANVGQPMEESPVGVTHSAGILDLKDWINPLNGYQYDSMNKDALLHMPFNYKVLVIPEGCLVSDDVRTRIEALRRQGIIIIDKPYRETIVKGLEPDVILPSKIAWCHRAVENKHIYFLSNQTDSRTTLAPTFRHNDAKAYLYDPLTDSYMPYDGTVELHPYGSAFVVFGDEERCLPQPVTTCLHQRIPTVKVKNLNGSWQVDFMENGLTLSTDSLFDWSQYKDDRIRYFSGHARYTTTLRLKAKEVTAVRAWLSLPNVKDIAHVWINGKDCGIVWTAPYEVEITGALKKGRNKIEIEVVNTWHNALRGADSGKAPYEGIWTNAKYRTKGDGLLPAGLLAQPEIGIER